MMKEDSHGPWLLVWSFLFIISFGFSEVIHVQVWGGGGLPFAAFLYFAYYLKSFILAYPWVGFLYFLINQYLVSWLGLVLMGLQVLFIL